MKKTLGATALFFMQNGWKILSVFLLAFATFLYLTDNKSYIDTLYANATEYQTTAQELKAERDKLQREYEVSTWKARCYDSLLSVNADRDMDCEQRSVYEKFASYNEGK